MCLHVIACDCMRLHVLACACMCLHGPVPYDDGCLPGQTERHQQQHQGQGGGGHHSGDNRNTVEKSITLDLRTSLWEVEHHSWEERITIGRKVSLWERDRSYWEKCITMGRKTSLLDESITREEEHQFGEKSIRANLWGE